MVLPAYDQCIKASHIFNLLDARGVISVTERQSYIFASATSPGVRRRLAEDTGRRGLRLGRNPRSRPRHRHKERPPIEEHQDNATMPGWLRAIKTWMIDARGSGLRPQPDGQRDHLRRPHEANRHVGCAKAS